MTTHYEIMSPREDRQGKTRWLKIGAAFPRDKGGFSIVLDALPLADKEGRVSLLMAEPLPRDGNSGGNYNPPAKAGGNEMPEDSIPF